VTQPPSSAPPPPGSRPTTGAAGNGLAIAGMVCGIISIVTAFLIALVGLITGILALVFGFMGRNRAVQMGGAGQTQATAALVTGGIGVVLSIIAYIIVFNALT
jgi:hypothetical protein